MTVTVKGREQSMAGEVVDTFQLELTAERITARELIRSRVFQRVKDCNAREMQREGCTSDNLVPRDESELILNGRPDIKARMTDFPTEFDRAVKAFQQNRILVLADGRPLTDLDDEIQVDSTTEISFLRLTMLAGG